MPKDLPKLKLRKGESAARSSHGILALKWIDRKDLYMLSTKHANVEMCDTVNSTKMQYVSYRLDVAEQLLRNVELPDYNTRGRPAQSDIPLRLQSKIWAHFPHHILPTQKKRHPTRVCK
ncbi:hypothetical protein Bhyg_13121, partial [Pseudolycoriella hygida]